jgi:threonine/homoserine/homoserine lactone efflux protein
MFELLTALIAFLLPLAYSPGPDNLFFAANGARFGTRKTLPANAGYHVATILVTLAIGMGFGLIATRHPQLLEAIKYIGSAYVLYLAYRMYRAGTVNGASDARPAGFVEGGVLLLFNPNPI